jgi:hypothetical protein
LSAVTISRRAVVREGAKPRTARTRTDGPERRLVISPRAVR